MWRMFKLLVGMFIVFLGGYIVFNNFTIQQTIGILSLIVGLSVIIEARDS